ncbi:MAG: NAD(P)/FAD-dependent oxidoreductase [Calditrichaceae bacterium]|jgi:phytoene dehydrogenase-like protein
MKKKIYDVIIIGSGIGGLASASILSQVYRKKVLVLERHSKLGGYTHTFKRKAKYQWDVGVHYIGDLQPKSDIRNYFDYISGGQLHWNKMPSPYDVFIYPDITFEAKVGKISLLNDLMTQFPTEKDALKQYFKDIEKASNWYTKYIISNSIPKIINPLKNIITHSGRALALQTTKNYLDNHFRDKWLKGILVSQWGNYGLPPALSTFCTHATIVNHYINGGWYPVGGASKIAESIADVVENAGGQFLKSHQIDEIIIHKDKAIGVRVTAGQREKRQEEFFADKIISNAGAYNTFIKLIPAKYNIPYREDIRNFPKCTSNVSLFIGLNGDPHLSWVNGENYWIYDSFDHNKTYHSRNDLLDGKAHHAFVSFPSLKDPEKEHHTAEIIAFTGYGAFKEWADQPVKNRNEEYGALKERISKALIDFVNASLPNFRQLIDYYELGTPLTNEHYTGHHRGCSYGLPGIPERFQKKWLRPKTSIKNLYLTGADAAMHGVVPCMMSGILSATLAMGRPQDMVKIAKNAKRFSSI